MRDVPRVDPADDNYEIDLKRFLPLLGIAAISSVALTFASIFAMQIRTAQLQNHIYCELLRPGMIFEEVGNALNKVGPHKQAWFSDTPYPKIIDKATSYTVVFWDDSRFERNYDIDLWLGYDANERLVWEGRHISGLGKVPFEKEFATIECPWSFQQSVTAR